MAAELERCRDRGIDRVVFGDIALTDVRAYREDRLAGSGLAGCWPLWERDPTALVEAVVAAGVRAVTVAVDADVLDEGFLGRPLDGDFLADLPDGVDPAGEHGEFHTFVWDDPGFETAVSYEPGETVTRPVGDGEFHYLDLLPGDGA
jgi:diphthamide synthase (EF-2-diphthine--ammonia ligase)